MSNHNEKGRFTKGNQLGKANKKDLTRSSTKDIATGELRYATELICRMSVTDLKKRNLDNETLLTHVMIKKALKGDFAPMQWLLEMSLGRPKQQVDAEVKSKVQIHIDSDDAKL